ncbi:hypothetical protein [Halalkalicoccus jeotgali]|uniref:Uncharacterized protein n=1 Tax=Halalkalicoccus jeotgali (strain DSM 18796 / CECT 7217 / JCM 14584 / KCTC 4019 / B3) TaxID=795797 RepID=D8J564_HALJB|nr:hypothetical protein [Halalkalicoccus jeotgali]ADJ13645.1 hypothetical protein HacjB3_01260 [Halalkalicoccus jeotgali B3]ELY33333.1 hypothetical protein C497_18072 [Halalkalicoccus jeotgali B3]
MPDTKRGRERSGRGKRYQTRIRDIEQELAALREGEPTLSETPLVATYTSEDGQDLDRVECYGFEELVYGVALYDAAGEQVAYVPHDAIVAIEPAD